MTQDALVDGCSWAPSQHELPSLSVRHLGHSSSARPPDREPSHITWSRRPIGSQSTPASQEVTKWFFNITMSWVFCYTAVANHSTERAFLNYSLLRTIKPPMDPIGSKWGCSDIPGLRINMGHEMRILSLEGPNPGAGGSVTQVRMQTLVAPPLSSLCPSPQET